MQRLILDDPKYLAAVIAEVRAERERRKGSTPEGVKARLLDEFPKKLHVLFDPHPYKIMYGGRLGIKSWSACQAILQQGFERPLRIVCLRETMKSLEDSVHTLMSDRIRALGLTSHYRVMDAEIRGANDTNIFYAGLHNNRSISIKSMEGVDIFFVEEAENVSQESWQTLIPTIRKKGAELWVALNPRFSDDPTYKLWIANPPPDAVLIQTSYRDNKWMTPEMQSKMDHLKTTDPDEFEHVYEGATKSTVQDAVYKAEIFAAEKARQFRSVPYDRLRVVDTYWDLGYDDMVAIWFVQAAPFEFRVIDYLEDRHQAVDYYLQKMQSLGYTYGTCVLPWDGSTRHLSTGKSTLDMIKSKGFKVKANRQGFVHDEINRMRTIFPQLWFDADKTAVGVDHLRKFEWGPFDPAKTGRREPIHNIHSHAARALGCLAMHIREVPGSGRTPPTPPVRRPNYGSLGSFR